MIKKITLSYLLLFVLSGLAVLLVLDRFDYPVTGVDDANIFFVYAKNLSNGYGFVYNIGGERVEGFTSFLWTLICALTFKLSPYPEFTLLFINIALIALGAAVATGWPIIFLVILFTSPAYVTWTTITLMDNGLWSTLLLLITIVVVGENVSSRSNHSLFIFLYVLLLFTRPEAFLWVPIFISISFVRRMFENGGSKAFKMITPSFTGFVLAVILLTLFRMWYFGFPLPNTYYAKVAPSLIYNAFQGGGVNYLVTYFTSGPIACMSILSVVFASIHATLTLLKKQPADNGLMFLPFIAIIGLFMPVLTGGDHFGSFRFYQNIYPILLLCLIYWIRFILPEYIPLEWYLALHRNWRIPFIGILVTCFTFIQTYKLASFNREPLLVHEFAIAKNGRRTGALIRSIFSELSELPSIGVIVSGGKKYTYLGEVMDLMGVNNTRMAHNKGNRRGIKNHAAFEKTIFYELKPAIVEPQRVNEKEWEFDENVLRKSNANRLLKQIFDDLPFSKLYTYIKISRKDTDKYEALVGWFSKNFLSHLANEDVFHIETYNYTVQQDPTPEGYPAGIP
jgi:hypothetical protein